MYSCVVFRLCYDFLIVVAGVILQGAVVYSLVFPLRSSPTAKKAKEALKKSQELAEQKELQTKTTKSRTPSNQLQASKNLGG